MNFKKVNTTIVILALSLFLIQCNKKNNLDIEDWITREAGVYDISRLEVIRYEDDVQTLDSVKTDLESTFVLRAQEGDEGTTYFILKIYGNYLPEFLNVPSDAFTWVTEMDNKRLTFGVMDPNYGYQAQASLTVDDMGKKSQKWHYVQNYTLNGKNVYVHHIYSAERR